MSRLVTSQFEFQKKKKRKVTVFDLKIEICSLAHKWY